MAENYAIKSITLVDFIDVRDIASGVPFWAKQSKAASYLISIICGGWPAAGQTSTVHFIAVLRTIVGNPQALKIKEVLLHEETSYCRF
jgi:hypothetical protein